MLYGCLLLGSLFVCCLVGGARFGLRLIVLVLSFFDLWLLDCLCSCDLGVCFLVCLGGLQVGVFGFGC